MNPNKILIILISISFIILGFALKNRSEFIEETKKNQQIENNISSTSTKRDLPQEKNTYLVKEGDTLWEIAEAKYGSGFKYHEIIKKNPGKTFKFKDGREGLIFPGTILDL